MEGDHLLGELEGPGELGLSESVGFALLGDAPAEGSLKYCFSS